MLSAHTTKTRTGAKRLLLAAAVAVFFGAAAALVSSSTFGFFSGSRTSSSNTFTAGTVTQAAPVNSACAVTNLFPNGTTQNCGTFQITYGGSVPAYLALDVLIETQSSSGGTKLYNPGDSGHGLVVTVSSASPAVSFTIPTTATTCPGSAPANSTCYELDKELVSTTAFTNGGSVTFTTSVSLPTSSPTGYQRGAAQVLLTAHAAQSVHNGSVGGCTAGQTCNGVSWS